MCSVTDQKVLFYMMDWAEQIFIYKIIQFADTNRVQLDDSMISMTSHERYGVLNHWKLDCFFSTFSCKQQGKH